MHEEQDVKDSLGNLFNGAQATVDSGTKKPSNPKDFAAQNERRICASNIPPEAIVEMSLAFLDGSKYGYFNYVVAPVSATTYVDAIWRHGMLKYLGGQTRDPLTGVHALGSVMACCAVLICAERRGTLIDDRPPFLENIAGLEALYRQTSERLEKINGPPKQPWTQRMVQKIKQAWKDLQSEKGESHETQP